MYIALGDYLQSLRTLENSKPQPVRREVPTQDDIAKAVGINPVSLSRIVTGKRKSLNLDMGAKIIDEMRRRGFQMVETDLVRYRPPLD